MSLGWCPDPREGCVPLRDMPLRQRAIDFLNDLCNVESPNTVRGTVAPTVTVGERQGDE